MDKPKPEKRIQVPLRLPSLLHKRLRSLAKVRGVSLNGFINSLLYEAVDEKKEPRQEPTPV